MAERWAPKGVAYDPYAARERAARTPSAWRVACLRTLLPLYALDERAAARPSLPPGVDPLGTNKKGGEARGREDGDKVVAVVACRTTVLLLL